MGICAIGRTIWSKKSGPSGPLSHCYKGICCDIRPAGGRAPSALWKMRATLLQLLLGSGELGVGLKATFRDIDAFVLFFLRDTDTDDFLQRVPDDKAGDEDPGEDGD